MKKIKSILYSIIGLSVIYTPIVLADSGLDSNYSESGSIVGTILETFMSCFQLIAEIFTVAPGTENYDGYHVLVAIICLLVIFITTLVHLFKLDNKKNNVGTVFIKIGISLIPTILFGLFSLLTNLYLIIYITVLMVYLVPLVIAVNATVKNKIIKNINKIKEIDKDFNEEDFNKNVFNIYNDVQIAWCSFDISKVKNVLSEDLYNKYNKKLDELKEDNKKNSMSDIEFKSNKITKIIFDKDITIKCELNVTCYDYITKEDKVVKGKDDKKYDYTYELEIKYINNKCVLNNKKMLKIKEVKEKK